MKLNKIPFSKDRRLCLRHLFLSLSLPFIGVFHASFWRRFNCHRNFMEIKSPILHFFTIFPLACSVATCQAHWVALLAIKLFNGTQMVSSVSSQTPNAQRVETSPQPQWQAGWPSLPGLAQRSVDLEQVAQLSQRSIDEMGSLVEYGMACQPQ